MVAIRYFLWEGDKFDVYGDEILDVIEESHISPTDLGIDIVEFEYPGPFKNIPELVQLSNYRLMKAMFTNERFYHCASVEREATIERGC